jgi:hypothetical protein
MPDKYARYSPSARFTASGWIRTRKQPAKLSWWERFIKWIMEE